MRAPDCRQARDDSQRSPVLEEQIMPSVTERQIGRLSERTDGVESNLNEDRDPNSAHGYANGPSQFAISHPIADSSDKKSAKYQYTANCLRCRP